jgi:hypothetical protein
MPCGVTDGAFFPFRLLGQNVTATANFMADANDARAFCQSIEISRAGERMRPVTAFAEPGRPRNFDFKALGSIHWLTPIPSHFRTGAHSPTRVLNGLRAAYQK